MTNKETTFKMLTEELPQEFNFEDYLKNGNHGLKFKHYWFQKNEYLLWKNWKEEEKTDEFKNYRFFSRNFIEHIYPQEDAKIDDEYLHSFGNLVLLSVSQNSESNYKSVSVKKSMFNEKKDTYDTLKSYCIFKIVENKGWNPKQIEKHRDEIIDLIRKHYNHA